MVRVLLFAAVMSAIAIAMGRGDESPSASEHLLEVRHREEGRDVLTQGRLLVTAADGGLLLETRNGRLVTIKPGDLISRDESADPYVAADAETLAAELSRELSDGFQIVRTKRYVIATDSTAVYAQWCGKLLERLQIAFVAHWQRAGLKIAAPERPLAAIIFADPADFAAYATGDAGAAVAASQGYYSIRTNRIVLTDLTMAAGQPGAATESEVLRRLESRVANLTTVVHEATHQIAFNCGLHTRYADNPMWLLEGMAMYCEAPDLKGTAGWKSIGRIHPGRLNQFREFAAKRRQSGSLPTLILTEDRFRDPATAVDAYAESWALTYYLIHERRDEYVAYLEALAAKPRLMWDTPVQRENLFLQTFHTDWETLDRDFLKSIQRLRAR
jgi:hypothetical protein